MAKRRTAALRRIPAYALGASALLVGVLGSTASAAPSINLFVDQGSTRCSDARARIAVTPTRPWCSLVPAGARAQPGDTIHVRQGTYVEPFRPTVSGTPDGPIHFVAEGQVTLTQTVKLSAVSNLVLEGFTVAETSAQGLWIDGSSNIQLASLVVTDNSGNGIAVKSSRAVTVSHSLIARNGGAGIMEYPTSASDTFLGNRIEDNGRDGNPYSGDGIQLAGVDGRVEGNTIERNGDAGPYEHGIYAAASASGYVIEGNVLRANAASDVKAAGSGTVRYNLMLSALFGLVVSDNPSTVSVYENVIAGDFQHAVLVTTGKTPAQAALWHNTIVQTGRSTTSGNASTVFVVSAAALDLRNNVICYTNPDNLGNALWVNAATLVTSLVSNANWLCQTDPLARAFAWNGSRVSTAQWQALSGQDAGSAVSSPPSFDSGFRALAPNLGLRLGQSLGITRDFVGTAVPSLSPDVGAYQTS